MLTKRCYTWGVTGRGDESSEAISRKGESCLHKYRNKELGSFEDLARLDMDGKCGAVAEGFLGS